MTAMEGGEGGGSGTQERAYPKWPNRILPMVNFCFPTMGPLVWGGETELKSGPMQTRGNALHRQGISASLV